MQPTREAIRHFITTNFYVADQAKLGDDDSLIESGIVDSTGVLEILAFLETKFGIHVDDKDVRPQNLDSVARIEAFIARVRAAGAPLPMAPGAAQR